ELDDLRINFVRPEGYAEGDPEITPRYQAVVPLLRKALYAMETAKEFRGKTFTFGGFPLCVLPPGLRNNDLLLKKFMGEYRDLSTDCSVRQDGDGFGIEEIQDGRSRFNWQDRKRFDLKPKVEACRRCDALHLCEGVWGGYQDIYGSVEVSPLHVVDGKMQREAPRLAAPPRPSDIEPARPLPHRLKLIDG
ncbi:MAG: hypothetical protein KC731_14310, partial [Myxococcales bacterium]|nr:hypothetical protein [Myxococcales bacterium]